jgi:hypothetical protein
MENLGIRSSSDTTSVHSNINHQRGASCEPLPPTPNVWLQNGDGDGEEMLYIAGRQIQTHGKG